MIGHGQTRAAEDADKQGPRSTERAADNAEHADKTRAAEYAEYAGKTWGRGGTRNGTDEAHAADDAEHGPRSTRNTRTKHGPRRYAEYAGKTWGSRMGRGTARTKPTPRTTRNTGRGARGTRGQNTGPRITRSTRTKHGAEERH